MSWIDRFPGLASLEPSIQQLLVSESKVLTVPRETVVFGPGKAAENLLLMLDGVVRVQQISEGGREIVLYRVRAGESCVLTTACLLAHENYSAQGIAETDVSAVAIPRKVFNRLVAESETFREFVFAAYSRRITDLFFVIEEIAFQRIDIRLALKLTELADADGLVRTTHQKMAAELGTAREVISRQLQEFQRRGWVAQSRGVIEILQPEEIGRLAQVPV